jgi:transcriptional regulator with PAS, ATPase and Fis domain
MIKVYKVRISFGNGAPTESTVEAKNGQQAQDVALKQNPGARSVYVLGVDSVKEEPPPPIPIQRPDLVVKQKEEKTHPLFTDTTVGQVKRLMAQAELHKHRQVEKALKMRSQGLSHQKIAKELGIGKTTVGTWLKQYGP